MMPPMAATTAGPEPEMAEKSTAAIMAAAPSPPAASPAMASAA